jgi:signal peptidase I
LLALLLVNIFSAKIRGEVPSVFGYSVLNIISGSMENAEDPDGGIPVGSYILVKRTDPKEIKRGDIISFYSNDPSIFGFPNTHRVVEEPIVTDGEYEFVTKGDANFTPDKYNAKGDRIIGRYVRRLDGVTSFVRMLEGNGMFIMFGVLGAAMVLMVAGAMIKGVSSAQNDEEEKK